MQFIRVNPNRNENQATIQTNRQIQRVRRERENQDTGRDQEPGTMKTKKKLRNAVE